MENDLIGFGPARTVGELKFRLAGLSDSTALFTEAKDYDRDGLVPVEVSYCGPDGVYPAFVTLTAFDETQLSAGTLQVMKRRVKMIQVYEIPETIEPGAIDCWYVGRFKDLAEAYLEWGNPNEGCQYISVKVAEDDAPAEKPLWIGAGFTFKHPNIVTLEEPLSFGGKVFPAGARVRAFDTRDFGYVIWENTVVGKDIVIGKE